MSEVTDQQVLAELLERRKAASEIALQEIRAQLEAEAAARAQRAEHEASPPE
jgi:hypothetical protein